MRYAPHELIVAPGRKRPELWRLVVGLVTAWMLAMLLVRGLSALASLVMSEEGYTRLAVSVEMGASPSGVIALLVLMGCLGAGAMLAAELIQKRRASSLFGPRRLAVWQFWTVLKALALLQIIVFVLPSGEHVEFEAGLDLRPWIFLLPLTFAALLLQTGAEEVLFRGYLQSQMAARFSHPLIWLAVPSALFAVGHYAPEYYGANAWLVTVWSFVFGLAAADLTARSGTLGPAIALHLVNNFMAIAVTSIQGDMSGLALWVYPFDPSDTSALRGLLPLDLMLIAVSWLAARVALRL